MRLLLLIPTLDRSGAEKQFTLLATHLPKSEFEVHVVALTRGGPLEEDLHRAGIPVTILHKKWKLDLACRARLKNLIKTWKPDILHTWLFTANAYGRLSLQKQRPKVLVSERCVDIWKSGWQTWLDRRLIGRTDWLTGNSQAVVEFYQKLGYSPERTSVIPNAIEIPKQDVSARDWLRKDLLHVPPGQIVITTVGRLAAQKNIRDAIWGFCLLRTIRDDVTLAVVGDGPERKALEQFTREVKFDHAIVFLGHREDVPQILAGSDLFSIASGFEGMSNSLMEAMAAGVPVVASDIPPNRELILGQGNEAEKGGMLFPVGDTPELARCLRELIENPTLATQYAEIAKNRLATEYTLPRMVDHYAALYRQLHAGCVKSSERTENGI